MAEPTYEDANVLLQAAQLYNSADLSEIGRWVLSEDFPANYTDFIEQNPPGSDGHAKLIKVSSDPAKEHVRDKALFHEFIHAILHSTGLTYVLQSRQGNLEEAVVMALEEHLFRLIKVSELGKKPEMGDE